MAARTSVVLYHGDDFEKMSELRREVEIAENKARLAELSQSSLRFGDEVVTAGDVKRAREAFTAFVDEAAERAETWVLEAIGHEEFRGLLKAHPPRKVNEPDGHGGQREVIDPDDEGWNVNTDTFGKALLLFVDPEDDDIRTVIEPDLEPAALRKRIKRLSKGEFDTLWTTAHALNSGGVADPKASPSYGIDPRSDET